MNRRSYVIKLEKLEPVILNTLEEQNGPVTLPNLRECVIKKANETGVESDVVRAAIMRLWEANKLKVSADRQVELAR
ncbi:MAG: hypothetical protein JKY37_25705 [Nannocystaceae bacterium]|nr:hypothetical protein [Nannocystaceae bacterium]